MLILANILPWLQVIVAVLLIGAILIQRSGEGIGSAFGGSSGGVFHAKRGPEKFVFITSIILAGLFIIVSVLNLFL
jgi:preprotein translocase subunit SecG